MYVTIIPIPLQKWQHERAPMLRYTYRACIVKHSFFVTEHVMGMLFSS